MNRLTAYLLSLGFAFIPMFSHALDLEVEPRAQTGIMDYVFEQKPAKYLHVTSGTDIDGNSVPLKPGESQTDSAGITLTNTLPANGVDSGFKLTSLMPLIGGGATIFANRFFLDLYVQKALSGSDSATNPIEFEGPDSQISRDNIIHSNFDRNEYSLSFGYALERQWVLYAGYRRAKTSFSDSITFNQYETDLNGEPVRVRRRGNRNISFDQNGFFFGSTYVYSIHDRTVIAFSAAVATLNGTYDSRTNLIEKVDFPNRESIKEFNIGFDQKGDTIGLNLGVAWKGQIAESVGYSIGVNGYSYDFKAKTEDVPDLSETVLRLSAGLSYQF
jgi:hypothetical protein